MNTGNSEQTCPPETKIREMIKEYYGICRDMNRIKEDEYRRFVSNLAHYNLIPLHPLIEMTEKDSDPGLARMLGALLAIIAAGYPPVVISDFDRTLTPFTEELAQSLGRILENKGEFGILTGNIKGAIDNNCLNLSEFESISDDPELMKRLHLFPKIASEHWTYDIAQNKHQLLNSSELAEEIGKRNGDGDILPEPEWDVNRGTLQLKRYEEILREMVDVFDLESGGTGYSVAGRLVVDLGSQMDVRITGENSADQDRSVYQEFEERDYETRKVYLREIYAAYVNIKTGQFDYERKDAEAIISELKSMLKARNKPMPEGPNASGKIPMKVRRAGRTNLEGVILGMDKAWALDKIAMNLNQPVWTLIFSGDEFIVGGNDWPALRVASVALNVREHIDKPYENPFFFTSEVKESKGLVKYYNLIGDVLKMGVNSKS